MIDINKIEDDIKELVTDQETDTVTDFVLTTKEEPTEMISVEENKQVVQEYISTQNEEDVFEIDFQYIRNNIKDIINMGTESLQQMISIASQSEHPRSYEVVATLIKALTDANKDLLATHIKKDEKVTVKSPQTNIQNNTVFVGSTAEFSKLMKEKMKNK